MTWIQSKTIFMHGLQLDVFQSLVGFVPLSPCPLSIYTTIAAILHIPMSTMSPLLSAPVSTATQCHPLSIPMSTMSVSSPRPRRCPCRPSRVYNLLRRHDLYWVAAKLEGAPQNIPPTPPDTPQHRDISGEDDHDEIILPQN